MLNKAIGYLAIALAVLFIVGAVAGVYTRCDAITAHLYEVPQ